MKRLLCLLALCAAPAAWAQDAAAPVPAVAASAPQTTSDTAIAPATLSAPEPTPLAAPAVAPVLASEPEPTPPAAPTPAIPPTPAKAAATVAPASPSPVSALVPAGRWDGDFSASLSLAEGSTKSMSVQLGLDATYQRPDDKLTLSGQYLESRARTVSNGVVSDSVTALKWRAGGRYDRNLNPSDFGFVGLDFSHDEVQQLRLRSEPSTGLGRHLVRERDDQWDVYAGLTWREDYYYEPGVEINGEQRTRYDTVDTLFGEESTHQLAEQLRFKQKFVVYPGLLSTQGTRATLDAGLLMDLNKTLSLSVKLQARYDAWAPAEKVDVLLLTGLSVKFRD